MRISHQPLTAVQRCVVVLATQACLDRAGCRVHRIFPSIPVSFDLRGRAAGMYRVRCGRREIRFNPYIFARDFDRGMTQTVPHEVAHYVVDMLFGARRVRPHGPEWREWMRALDAEPRATGHYDLSGLPVRSERRFAYRCACALTHQLSTRRHRAIGRGKVRYLCKTCGQDVMPVGEDAVQ